MLAPVRVSLVTDLAMLKAGIDVGTFAKTADCTAINDTSMCALLTNLSGEKQTYLQTFLNTNLVSLLQNNGGSTIVPFSFSTSPLSVTGLNGAPLTVAAMTLKGPSGAIDINNAMVTPMTFNQQLQLAAHENGHKVPIPGTSTYVDDNLPVDTFASNGTDGGGRIFLNTFGAAMVAYDLAHQSVVPVNIPSSFQGCLTTQIYDDKGTKITESLTQLLFQRAAVMYSPTNSIMANNPNVPNPGLNQQSLPLGAAATRSARVTSLFPPG